MHDHSNVMTPKELAMMMDKSIPREKEIYSEVARRIEEQITLHGPGETFDLDAMCRWIDARKPLARKGATDRLNRLVGQGVLEKINSHRTAVYKIVNRELKVLRWKTATAGSSLDIRWPRAHGEYDETTFGFADKITVRPNDLIVIAGVSNAGKSVFARNFLAENLDVWGPNIRMMLSEDSQERFKATAERMNWVAWSYSDNSDRFELIERHEDWKYAVMPGGLNIIDWVAMDGNFYDIRKVMEGIQSELRGGVAMVVLQKKEGNSQGEGGIFSEQRAAVYMNIDKGLLAIRKVKEPKYGNLDGLKYAFDIVNGAEFANIRQVKPCTRCRNRINLECDECGGTGYSAVSPWLPHGKGGE